MTSLMLAAAVATQFSFGEVKLDCPEQGEWKIDAVREELAKGVEVLKVSMDAPKAAKPPKFTVAFTTPQVDMYYRWTVNDDKFSIPPNWGSWTFSEFARHMPLYAFLNGNDESGLALASSECSRHVRFAGGVREEGSLLELKFVYFDAVEAPISHYETAICIDMCK